MSARASFLASAVLAALPLAAAIFGLYRLLSSYSRSTVVTPVAGVCQLAYEQTLDRAGHLGVAALLAVVFIFAARALLALWRGWRNTARIGKGLQAIPGDVTHVMDDLLAETRRRPRIEIVDGASPFAVTLGYLRPRIVLSSRLVEILDEPEMEAVIRHELVHAERLDPLRVLCAEFFRAGLPFVPALLFLLDQFGLRKEVEADAVVVRSMGSPAPLASALSKVIVELRDVPEYAGAGLSPTEARIDALLGTPLSPNPAWKVSALALASFISLSLMSGALFVLFSSPSMIAKHVCWPEGL